MKCAWKELLAILPQRIRSDVNAYGKENGQELRLRLDKPPELLTAAGSRWLQDRITEADLQFVTNAASGYSPWAASTSAKGYLTAPGGHRIGLCGQVYSDHGIIKGIRDVTSMNIRIARDFSGLVREDFGGNILILGPPGCGKTTILRDLSRLIAQKNTITVVDERGELFPRGFDTGLRMDILTGCMKADGISIALRTMGPSCIAVDEITDEMDCRALRSAAWCGVRLIATAHASCKEDFLRRSVYKPLVEQDLFDHLIVLKPDKSWNMKSVR